MKILIVAATPFEIAPLQTHLKHRRDTAHSYFFLITGVGQVATAFHLGGELSKHSYDLVINMGIAGSFHQQWALGSVVQVVSEQFAQLGAEAANGDFMDIFTMNLLDPDTPPFSQGKMINPFTISDREIIKASGITVDKAHGHEASIKSVVQHFDPDIESMEGAAVFYACLSQKVKFLEIRGISNYVEPRNKDRWEIGLAIEQLNKKVWQILDKSLI